MPHARPDDASPLTATRLSDYQPPLWLVERTELVFLLDESDTRVRARLHLRRNPARADEADAPLELDGRDLRLVRAEINGRALSPSDVRLHDDGLEVPAELCGGERLVWEAETRIDPKSNTALEGLYMSRDMLCTQCEAQGFRKITFYPDRPDVMSVFTVRIEAERARFPVLLSNGEIAEEGPLGEDRHFVEWRDPHPKPSYLFALVAGDLVAAEDGFTTASGREVALKLFTRPGDEDKTAYALDALKRSMRWDEKNYGREYDLDLFMIVAVDDFNMGAMENKGLNIFNSKYVLASPKTATDGDYALVESVVAHEYFHNWTGNRITCRDWFQLCLKEGLTVFRDQQFTEDARSEAVERIESVQMLRARQFREDAGPLAHPVRPESYVEINNFYTATVYEKGAEVVRMLRAVAGPDGYRRALDLYFERHDGQACTVEDFARCFEDACGLDLEQFRLWWSQAGTPRVRAEGAYDPEARRYALTLSQETKPTPNQPEKAALLIPFAVGLLTDDGAEIATPAPEGARPGPGPTHLLMLDAAEKTFVFEAVPSPPVLSLNRGFSAPVVVERKASEAERAFLLSCDTDPFARWEAGRSLAIDAVAGVAADLEAGRAPREVTTLIDALGATLRDAELEPAFRALALKLPSDDELAAEVAGRPRPDGAPGWADPDAIHAARVRVRLSLAERLQADLLAAYDAMATPGPYRPTAEDTGKRALKNVCMAHLAQMRHPSFLARVEAQFADADNMTDQTPALATLCHVGAPAADAALERFYAAWSDDPLVLGKWFGIQATSPLENALDKVIALTEHPAFQWKNPNKFRSLIGSFAHGNLVNFHRRDGAGYRFFSDWLLRLDPVNPQTTAKLVSAFDSWRRYDERRQGLMLAELDRMSATKDLSKDTREMVNRMLQGAARAA